MNRRLNTILVQCVSITVAFALGAVVIKMIGISPLFAYGALLNGSFGSINAIGETLVKMTPLILTGLSYAFAARAGLINIGAEGQLYVGGILATLVGSNFAGLPMIIHVPFAVAAAFAGGAVWGGLVGLLKVKFGANEIITTVMLNYIAIYLVSFLVTGPMKAPPGTMPESRPIVDSAQLVRILPGTRLHIGIFIALLALLFYYFFIFKMRQGYEMRVVGNNMESARAAGMRPQRTMVLAMLLAGGMGGLAGGVEILGIQGRLLQSFSPGYGFDGIAVALVGVNNPVGIVLGALLFGFLRAGGNRMQLIAQVPVSVIYVVQGLVITFVIIGQNLHVFQKVGVNRPFRRKTGDGPAPEVL
ncbi:ABC transporter permease [Sediminispirochaeta smaragdinae]|jgi:simple sugar transport system permease protein|uniref:Inner-membrane translocator n=1 Tax=Sediminispirochaeta smaragdinae (strain DSM 11293 / JCM 15392 / SEBR 4228) TaxID=573413 RepID=E1R0T8_SEDSS|nr:ABC transporter permease [Sediminispirochaeta smaragdinae]ADK80187.1 inner-membrane translocator [Sediminispirochaeta smaragdinae DSM 11293]